jgi:hypothetical protein
MNFIFDRRYHSFEPAHKDYHASLMLPVENLNRRNAGIVVQMNGSA